jgi:predicted lipoprotein with Yx(FWY)xxD motif
MRGRMVFSRSSGIAFILIAGLALLWSSLPAGTRGALAQGVPTVQTRATSLGTVLTGNNGMTLYTLSADSPGVSRCTGACTTAWPPLLLAAGSPAAPPGLPGQLGVIMRPDGGRQVMYNDQPLYFFVRDQQPGDTNGEGVNAFGGVWHVVRVAAAAMAPAAASTSPHVK